MRNLKQTIRIALLVVALATIAFYGSYEFKNYFAGPSVTLATPLAAVSRTQIIDISGETKSIAHITLNGRPIFIDETGAFRETVVLLPGYNTITIRAEDRFGNETEVVREIVYTGEMPDSPDETESAHGTTSTSTVTS